MSFVLSLLVAGGCFVAPVDAPVVAEFEQPACTWCPGHRGVKFGLTDGDVVRAAAPGTVSFSGVVVDVRYVVVSHADGTRATYGGLRSSQLRRGQYVALGDRIGIAGEQLHFGLRDGDRYLDPEPLLGELATRPYLIPIDGTPPREVPRTPVCAR